MPVNASVLESSHGAAELRCLGVSWEAECHEQLGQQRSEPREREQEAKMLQCTTAVRD